MTPAEALIEYLSDKIGKETVDGSWLTITQDRIDRFAEVTGDIQWIHTDPQRAATDSPYGTTVAHGYLTLSLLPFLTQSNHPDFFRQNYPGMKMRVNYGLNRVRFPAPVLAGSRVRSRSLLESAEIVGEGVQLTYKITVDIEGNDKPACVAQFLARVYP